MNEKNQPLVSIVTITYNSARFVRDAIQSVLAQQYTSFEYIIGDDCSTDETWDIIQEYADQRIIKYRNDHNIGEYNNRNKAIGMAAGKYLLFIDGDDVLLSHGTGYFVDMMEKFPEAAMCIQKGYLNNIIYPAVFSPEELLRNHYFGKEDLLSSSFASNMFRLDILKKSGQLKTHYKGGDNEIRIRIAKSHPVLFIAGWVSWPRETPGSASSGISLAQSMAEMYLYTKELILGNRELPSGLVNDIDGKIKSKIARYVVRCLMKFRYLELVQLRKTTGIKLINLGQYLNFKPGYSDPLANYTPVEPFKRDYLK